MVLTNTDIESADARKNIYIQVKGEGRFSYLHITHTYHNRDTRTQGHMDATTHYCSSAPHLRWVSAASGVGTASGASSEAAATAGVAEATEMGGVVVEGKAV